MLKIMSEVLHNNLVHFFIYTIPTYLFILYGYFAYHIVSPLYQLPDLYNLHLHYKG